jgi:hypothetical protein
VSDISLRDELVSPSREEGLDCKRHVDAGNGVARLRGSRVWRVSYVMGMLCLEARGERVRRGWIGEVVESGSESEGAVVRRDMPLLSIFDMESPTSRESRLVSENRTHSPQWRLSVSLVTGVWSQNNTRCFASCRSRKLSSVDPAIDGCGHLRDCFRFVSCLLLRLLHPSCCGHTIRRCRKCSCKRCIYVITETAQIFHIHTLTRHLSIHETTQFTK